MPLVQLVCESGARVADGAEHRALSHDQLRVGAEQHRRPTSATIRRIAVLSVEQPRWRMASVCAPRVARTSGVRHCVVLERRVLA